MKKSDKFENAYIAVLAIMIAIVAAIIGLNMYSSMKNVESNITLEELAQHELNEIESASSSIGNNVEQSENNLEASNIENNDTNTNEVQTSTENIENNEDVTNNEDRTSNEQTPEVPDNEEETDDTNAPSEDTQEIDEDSQNEETTNTNSEPESEPITFVKPVEGEIMKEFAKDNLVYSETLLEWTTHLGMDIKAEKTTVVKSAAEGTVKSIKNDPRYGLTIIIEHKNGYQTVYSNLLSSEFVVEGENVIQGQSIGTVGNSATFEIADASHLHFELIQNGVYLDPTIYIK